MARETQKSRRQLRLVDQIGGATRAVALVGNVLLAGVGFRVVALRISRGERLTIVGQSPPLTGIVERIVVAGSRAYVDAGYSIHILDVSDPTHPELLGEVPQEYAPGQYLEYHPACAEVRGRLFVASNCGLLVFEVLDPTSPRFIGTHQMMGKREGGKSEPLYFRDLALVGDLACAAISSGLAVLDLSSPSQPTLIAQYQIPDQADAIVVAPPYVYLGTDAGLHRIDVSDPTHPRSAGFFGSAWPIYATAIAGQTAYAVAGRSGLYVIDLSDPERLVAISHHSVALYLASDIVVQGSRAYIADDEGGLSILDLSDPARLRPLGCNLTVPDVSGVAIKGRHAFVVDGRGYLLTPGAIWIKEGVSLKGKVGGLRSADLEAAPVRRLRGWVELSGHGQHVVIQGSTAYVTIEHGVCQVDITDPERPKKIGEIDGLVTDGRIVPAGKLLYAASGERLSIMSVSKSGRARELAGCEMKGEIADLAVTGGVAYVATGNGLQMVDVRAPRRPVLLGHYPAKEGVDCLAVANSVAYLCVEYRLLVVDVSDPTNPALLGSIETGCCGNYIAVRVAGTLAYVVAWDNVSVVDVSDPARPMELASHSLDDREDWVKSAALAGDRLYVACGNNGLLVFKLV